MKKQMAVLKDAKNMVTRPGSHVHWVKLLIAFGGLLALSFGISYLFRIAQQNLNWNLTEFELLAYVSVFVASLVANATIIAPVPFAIAIMVTAAKSFDPVIVALCAATGGTLGELSGYYAGRLGRKIAIPDSIIGYKKVEFWVNKYGPWAIIVLAFQPIIPFDIGGLVAGFAKMPLYKFLPALWVGKFPKYLLLCYAGLGLINFLPSWMFGG
jgi:membrane protein YqaA with SNARE-associated domain